MRNEFFSLVLVVDKFQHQLDLLDLELREGQGS